MGLFKRKTDKEIIEEGRKLYIKGDLSGADLKLIKLAMKGNPEACYWVGRISLEVAEKDRNPKRRESGRFFLEKAAGQGHKDACALLAKAFDVPNPYAVKENIKAEAEAKARAEAEAKARAEAEAEVRAEAEKEIQEAWEDFVAKSWENLVEIRTCAVMQKYAAENYALAKKYLVEIVRFFLKRGNLHRALSKAVDFRDNCNDEETRAAMQEFIDSIVEECKENVRYEVMRSAKGKPDEVVNAEIEIEEAQFDLDVGEADKAFAVWEKYAEKGYASAKRRYAYGLLHVKRYEEALEYADRLRSECEDQETKESMESLIDDANWYIGSKETDEANDFLAIAGCMSKRYLSETNEEISGRKLQLMLFLAQIMSLQQNNKLLFNAAFYGRKYGPFSKIFHSMYLDGNIPVDEFALPDALEAIDLEYITQEELSYALPIVNKVVEVYASKKVCDLVELCCKSKAWKKSRKGISEDSLITRAIDVDDLKAEVKERGAWFLNMQEPDREAEEAAERFVKAELKEALYSDFTNLRFSPDVVWKEYAGEEFDAVKVSLANELINAEQFEKALELAEPIAQNCKNCEICDAAKALIKTINSHLEAAARAEAEAKARAEAEAKAKAEALAKNDTKEAECEVELDIITLTLEDGEEVDFNILCVFQVENMEYIALEPCEGFDSDEVLLYRYDEMEDGTMVLDTIDDEDEYNVACEKLTDLFN